MSIATKNVWIDSERDRWARFTRDLPEKRESTSNACMPSKNSRIDHKIQESRSCLLLGPSASCILKIFLEDVNFFMDK